MDLILHPIMEIKVKPFNHTKSTMNQDPCNFTIPNSLKEPLMTNTLESPHLAALTNMLDPLTTKTQAHIMTQFKILTTFTKKDNPIFSLSLLHTKKICLLMIELRN